MVEVTQADRSVAAAYWKVSRIGNGETQRRYLAGESDQSFIVQAFAAHRLAARAEWKPIETAPKSGDPILLYKPDERMVGEYIIVGYWGEWPGKGECWIACDGKPQGYFSEVSQSRQGYPTHWMPLPSPPQLVVGAAMIAKAGE